MKATELRIGNLVSANDFAEGIYVIGEIKPDSVVILKDFGNRQVGYNLPIERILPVEVTQDWLDKFGFEDYEPKDKYLTGYYLPFKNHEGALCEFPIARAEDDYYLATDSVDELDIEYNFQKPIKFVHELQNLFFAMTGVELTVKNG